MLDAASRDEHTSDVMLGLGIVKSVGRHSQGRISIEIVIGNFTQEFFYDLTAGQLSQNDSVMFAHIRQSGEMICIATVDVSKPGRITHSGVQRRRREPRSLSAPGLGVFSRKDLGNQAEFAAMVPGSGGALAVFVMAMGVWDWGNCSLAVFAFLGLWVILLLVALDREKNYGSMAKMKLDIGYVQKVEKWERHVSESGTTTDQSIVIAETVAGDSVNRRAYQGEKYLRFTWEIW